MRRLRDRKPSNCLGKIDGISFEGFDLGAGSALYLVFEQEVIVCIQGFDSHRGAVMLVVNEPMGFAAGIGPQRASTVLKPHVDDLWRLEQACAPCGKVKICREMPPRLLVDLARGLAAGPIAMSASGNVRCAAASIPNSRRRRPRAAARALAASAAPWRQRLASRS